LIGVTSVSAITVREPHQIAVGARRIDDDEIAAPLDRRDRFGELPTLGLLVVGDLHRTAEFDATMLRLFEVGAGGVTPGAAVVEIAGETGVEIDRRDALAGLEQRHREMHCERRLARAALLVAEDNDARRAELCR
jgi:hypothetical protein